jgi:hypothetical protein
MTNYEHYLQHSYDAVKRAESMLTMSLTEELESYLVRLFANYMDKPNINTEPVCIKLLESTSKPISQRMPILREVGDECLLINSMEWGKRRWPSATYYQDLGQSAYTTRAFIKRPPDMLYDDLAIEFETVTKILRNCRPL